MYHVKVHILIIPMLLCLIARCNSPSNPTFSMNPPDSNLIDRKPAVAGQFYPGTAVELQQSLSAFFSELKEPADAARTAAIISPHAGYVFSGSVAAAAYNQLDADKDFGTIFIIGCSHRYSFAGGSIYTQGNYITPLGTVKVDLEIARKLATSDKSLSFDPQYQLNEHSIEVQVPFLQYHLKKPFRIVPILLGTQDPETCRKIAQILKPYYSSGHLFVISTDFSHYPAYNDALKVDKELADAILTNSPKAFLAAEEGCLKKSVPELATGCCSWPAVLTLMYMTENDTTVEYRKIQYKNSGDSKYGEMDRVVGYNAISLVKRNNSIVNYELTSAEKKELLAIARNTIAGYLTDHEIPALSETEVSPILRQKAGAFVTLKKSGELRGCIGHFDADKALYMIVQEMAVATSTQDYRFSPATPDEMKNIAVEISVLTPMKKIHSVSDIQLGRDGIYIKKGGRGGTFLPQVATETGWSLEEFLGHCARDKAGIGWDGWKDKDAEIFTYQALVFHE
ncbi:MAG: AmmeMemoRadiSam system protein B [Bacteroidetes bacterium]|nr:AmmeMemoRadiSam system protein B [Bacteroidota bacterium]